MSLTHAHNPWTVPDTRLSMLAYEDSAALDACKEHISRHLRAAMLECTAELQGLNILDDDKVMDAIRAQFDPETGAVTDCFTEAFWTFKRELDAT